MIHDIYKLIGKLFCLLLLLFTFLRDFLVKPKEDNILFIAHPDDDTLFFHEYIKEERPYIILLTMGWSLRRIPGFIRLMQKHKIRYKIYPLEADDMRIDLLKKIIKKSLRINGFKKCITHNFHGEYGHPMHKKISKAVYDVSTIPVYMTENENMITNYKLTNDSIKEKEDIFNKYYKSELFVLTQYRKWVEHEHIVRIK